MRRLVLPTAALLAMSCGARTGTAEPAAAGVDSSMIADARDLVEVDTSTALDTARPPCVRRPHIVRSRVFVGADLAGSVSQAATNARGQLAAIVYGAWRLGTVQVERLRNDDRPAVVFFDSSGEPRWSFDLPVDSLAYAAPLHMDDDGNVYLAVVPAVPYDFGGGVVAPGSPSDVVVFSLDSERRLRWTRLFSVAAGEYLGLASYSATRRGASLVALQGAPRLIDGVPARTLPMGSFGLVLLSRSGEVERVDAVPSVFAIRRVARGDDDGMVVAASNQRTRASSFAGVEVPAGSTVIGSFGRDSVLRGAFLYDQLLQVPGLIVDDLGNATVLSLCNLEFVRLGDGPVEPCRAGFVVHINSSGRLVWRRIFNANVPIYSLEQIVGGTDGFVAWGGIPWPGLPETGSVLSDLPEAPSGTRAVQMSFDRDGRGCGILPMSGPGDIRLEFATGSDASRSVVCGHFRGGRVSLGDTELRSSSTVNALYVAVVEWR